MNADRRKISGNKMNAAEKEKFFGKLLQHGIDLNACREVLPASKERMEGLQLSWPSPVHSYPYDTVKMLGLGQTLEKPMPRASKGWLVLRHGGYSFQDLVESDIGRKYIYVKIRGGISEFAWYSEKIPAGDYRLRIPTPNTYRKTFEAQKKLLANNESPAPAVLVASMFLCRMLHCESGGKIEELGIQNPVRCCEAVDGRQVIMRWWLSGKLEIEHDRACEDYAANFLHLASVVGLAE